MIVSSIYDMAQFIMQGYRFQPYKIVEIKDLYDDGTALVGNMYIKVSELNFFSENIDWEQRRYELAKDIIKVVIANDNGANSEVVAKYSLNCADALIKRLKKG